MLDSLILRWFFIIVIIIYIIGFMIPLVLIKQNGRDPHGTHEGASLIARLSSVSILTWLVYIILYIIFGDLIRYFWAFSLLISDGFIISGIILIILGVILEGLGIFYLGINFRIELPKEQTELITNGIYRLMRNPIVFGVYLLVLGSFFIIPTMIFLSLLIIIIITFDSKARAEEKFLSKRFGEKYKNYKKKVGRYLPFTIKK